MMRDGKYDMRCVISVITVVLGSVALATMPFAEADDNSRSESFPPNSEPAGPKNGEASNSYMVGQTTASCVILDSKGKPVLDNNDPLAKLLLASGACPRNVFELHSRLLAAGAKIRTTLVANRGFHNPKLGSFSMFELVSGRLSSLAIDINDGEFFFGHFTGTRGVSTLIAEQQPDPDALMIELIAWDPVKQVFNFYELIGDGQKGQWFYRGNSLDILIDVTLLHRQPNPSQPKFGNRLRCSACHTAGGPIMKELAAPHNDWWTTARPLPFGQWKPDADLSRILQGLVDAGELAKSVKVGLSKLYGSEKFQQAQRTLSLQEQLRPLFCPVELNLASDSTPFDQKGPQIKIPSAFFVHPMLTQGAAAMARAHYDAALAATRAKFPETSRADADHAWLTPVKAYSDSLTIASLVKQGIIDQEFVSDVLAIDLTNPLFSTARRSLLRMLPNNAAGDWQAAFKTFLKAGKDPAAQELFSNLTDPGRNAKFHQDRATRFLNQCQARLQTKDAVIEMYRLLAQRRAEVRASEISKNPRGQILEPGFRLIFPVVTPAATPGRLRLAEDGKVISQ